MTATPIPLPAGAASAYEWQEQRDGSVTRIFAGDSISVGCVRAYLWGEQSAYQGNVLERGINVADKELTAEQVEELVDGLRALVAELRAPGISALAAEVDALATPDELESLAS
jgi:hypothetical protein